MDQVVIRKLEYSPFSDYQEHQHTETQITLFMSGGVEEQVGDHCNCIGPLGLVIKPAGLTHMDRFLERGAKTIQLSIDPVKAYEWGISERLSNYQSKYCPQLVRRFLCLLNGESPRPYRQGVKKFISDLLESIGPSTFSRKTKETDVSHWLSPIAERIDREFQQNLSLQDLASRHDKHPVHLARAFRAKFGQSVKQRICQLRVQHATIQLCETEKHAAAIAQDCGFSDQSHLNRVFKSVTGIPPIKYRKLVLEKKGLNVSFVQ